MNRVSASAMLSQAECVYFGNLISQHPDQTHFLPDNQLLHTVYKLTNRILVQGNQVGEGSWGKVFIAANYRLGNGQYSLTDIRVLKIPYARNAIGRFINDFVNIQEKMIEEVRLIRNLYGYGESIALFGTNIILHELPYLGDATLEKLLQSNLNEKIPLREWFSLFVKLTNLVFLFHKINQKVHNDINTKNILISLICRDYDRCFVFSDVRLADFGSAHLPKTFALPGRLSYQPPEILVSSMRDEMVDVFTLGNTIKEVLGAIKNNFIAVPDVEALKSCEALTERMTSKLKTNRPVISVAFNELLQILASYDAAIEARTSYAS